MVPHDVSALNGNGMAVCIRYQYFNLILSSRAPGATTVQRPVDYYYSYMLVISYKIGRGFSLKATAILVI